MTILWQIHDIHWPAVELKVCTAPQFSFCTKHLHSMLIRFVKSYPLCFHRISLRIFCPQIRTRNLQQMCNVWTYSKMAHIRRYNAKYNSAGYICPALSKIPLHLWSNRWKGLLILTVPQYLENYIILRTVYNYISLELWTLQDIYKKCQVTVEHWAI